MQMIAIKTALTPTEKDTEVEKFCILKLTEAAKSTEGIKQMMMFADVAYLFLMNFSSHHLRGFP